MPSLQPSQSSKSEEESRTKFMSNFPPALIHRVMLTDPANFPNLTMSGQPRETHTPSFREFAAEHGFLPPSPPPSSPSSSPSAPITGEGSGSSIADHISQTIRRAYHDQMHHDIVHSRSYAPLTPTVLELHSTIRSLVPNRTDLHGLLSDEDVVQQNAGGGDNGGDTTQTTVREGTMGYLRRLGRIAECLANLESENRSVTTLEWSRFLRDTALPCIASSPPPSDDDDEWNDGTNVSIKENGANSSPPSPTLTSIRFAMASTFYLHTKAETCRREVVDFHLGHILAPKIRTEGREYLRSLFRQRYGEGDGADDDGGNGCVMVPNTEAWVKEMVAVDQGDGRRAELRESEEKRAEMLLITGWVDQILFRAPRTVDEGDGGDQSTTTMEEEKQVEGATTTNRPVAAPPQSPQPFLVPEVLSMDIESIANIRNTTRLSVVGSALALHATVVAGVGDAVLRREAVGDGGGGGDGVVEACRKRLVGVMGNKAVGSRELYERGVGDVVVDLARVWNTSLDPSAEDTLQSRTSAVLRGEDPVLKLLDNRMRAVFRSMMLWTPQTHSTAGTNTTTTTTTTQQQQNVPVRLRTGRSLTLTSGTGRPGGSGGSGENAVTYDSMFRAAARAEFASKGFAFYSVELADANLTANRIINLVLDLYGADILDDLVVRECSS